MCSDCARVNICGRVTDPKRTGVECPHFKQWTSSLSWMSDALNRAQEEAALEAMCEVYDGREHMVW